MRLLLPLCLLAPAKCQDKLHVTILGNNSGQQQQQQIEMPLDSRSARHLRKYSIPIANARWGGLCAHICMYVRRYLCVVYMYIHIYPNIYSPACLIVCSFYSLTHSLLGLIEKVKCFCVWAVATLDPSWINWNASFKSTRARIIRAIQSYHILNPTCQRSGRQCGEFKPGWNCSIR